MNLRCKSRSSQQRSGCVVPSVDHRLSPTQVLTEQLAAQGVQYENTSGDLAASRQALKTAQVSAHAARRGSLCGADNTSQLEVDRLKDNLAEVEEQLADRSTRLNEAQDAQVSH